MVKPRIVLLIFVSGKVVLTGKIDGCSVVLVPNYHLRVMFVDICKSALMMVLTVHNY